MSDTKLSDDQIRARNGQRCAKCKTWQLLYTKIDGQFYCLTCVATAMFSPTGAK